MHRSTFGGRRGTGCVKDNSGSAVMIGGFTSGDWKNDTITKCCLRKLKKRITLKALVNDLIEITLYSDFSLVSLQAQELKGLGVCTLHAHVNSTFTSHSPRYYNFHVGII